MKLKMAGLTDVGRLRKNNQDNFYCDELRGIVIVADGIGGRQGGATASRLAIEGVVENFTKKEKLRVEEVPHFIFDVIDRVNRMIMGKGEENSDVRGMGTTLNFLVFLSNKVYISHVGDSRTYLFYKDHLWQLTTDHNVENLRESGIGRDNPALAKAKGEALVKSLGLLEICEPDIYDLDLNPGSILITCSDGLTNMVSDRKILDIIKKYGANMDALVKRLVDEANRNGGKDNITVVATMVEKAK